MLQVDTLPRIDGSSSAYSACRIGDRRGGGNQGRKYHRQAFTCLEFDLLPTAPAPISTAAHGPGSAALAGPSNSPDTKATRLHHPAFPCSSQPRIQSPRRRCHSRKQRIRQEACCGCAGVRGSGGGPSHPMQCRELPVSINSVFQCSIPGSVRSPGRFQDSALKCSMAARGSAAAPGGTRRTIPRSRRVRDGKGWAVDGETW